MKSKGTVAVAMSGGVDSSIVAYVLKKEGYDLFGITMKHLDKNEDSPSRSCCSLGDIYDAKKICHDLNIPHYTINLQKEFKSNVLDNFIAGYKRGVTPNPCVICNRKVKLGALLEKASQLGASFLATGHYAILENGKLYPGVDKNKDQSYFLSHVEYSNLKKLLLPLGKLTKEEVRAMAVKFRSKVATKRDSSGICFIKSDFKSFFEENLKKSEKRRGEFVDLEGNVLGHHDGVHNFTLGQRRGMKVASDRPLYVKKIEPISGKITLAEEKDLYGTSIECGNINVLIEGGVDSLNGISCYVKTRALDTFNLSNIEVEGDKLKIFFEEKVRAATPGQTAAIYGKDMQVLGSGIIL